MIGLDTNVVIRYLVQDEPDQSTAASELIEGFTQTDPGYISLITMVEVYWVLRRAYKVSADRCAELMDSLVEAREIRVGHDDVVRAALSDNSNGVEFADAVIGQLGRAAGCDYTMTFDRRAAHHESMQLLRTPRSDKK